MVEQFLFIEEGSVDIPSIQKFLKNSGLTDANVIRYKKGSPKPELVSVNNDEKRIEALKAETTKNIMQTLIQFLEQHAVIHPEFVKASDMYIGCKYNITYQGDVPDFMEAFYTFLKEKELINSLPKDEVTTFDL